MADDNRIRALAEVASLDAWHKGFTASRKAVELHVDVAFAEGRVGGEPGDPVRFRLALKRATVVVVVPPFEKLGIDRASVSRDAPTVKVKASEVRKTRTRLGLGGKAKGKAALTGLNASGVVDAVARAERSRERAIRITQELGPLSVMQMQTADGDYAWVIEPTLDGRLHGRPWNAHKRPRMKVVDLREERSRGLEPAVTVELRCRRMDLDIQGIAPTAKRDLAALAADPFGPNKMRAVEAVIRTRLARAGLLHGDLEDPYAEIVLCAVLAEGDQ